jgi:hypothetical protein
MRRALRIVLAIIKWLVIAVVAALAVVVLVNLRHAELTPEARSLSELHNPSVADRQNLYLALVGFDAPAGADPIITGARIVAEYNATAASNPSGRHGAARATSEGAPARNEGRLAFTGAGDNLPNPFDLRYLSYALEHASDIRAMTAGNAELVSRYLAMQSLSAFSDTSVSDIVQSRLSFGDWNRPHALLLLRASLDAQTGRVGPAFDFIAADISMWRSVLGSNGSIVDQLIASRLLARDFRALSDFIAAPTFDVRANEAKLREILVPLTPAELDVAQMFKREFEMQAKLIDSLTKEMAREASRTWINRLTNDDSLRFGLFFKPNASLNVAARIYSGLQTLASHSPFEFVRLRDKVVHENQAISRRGFYNPIGVTIVRAGSPNYADYIAQVFDLAAYIRLVRAQLDVRLASAAPNHVTALLASASPETRNPYTELPFGWNASDNTLFFEPMSSRWREWAKAGVPPSGRINRNDSPKPPTPKSGPVASL